MDPIALRVAERWLKQGMEFPTENALRTYLKEHPKAKARNHKVKKTKHDDAAEPSDHKEVERASKAVESMGKLMEQVFEQEDDVSHKGQNLADVMEDLEDSIDTMAKGINHIPAGTDRDRAKKIHTQVGEIVEKLNDAAGYRWKAKGRGYRRFLSPDNAKGAYGKIKPLIAELDKLLAGQRVLLASR